MITVIQRKISTLTKTPMVGGFESFNVSVTTGIILYETMKQRIGI